MVGAVEQQDPSPYSVPWRTALWAGLVATGVFIPLIYATRLEGRASLDFPHTLGSVVAPPGPTAHLVGGMAHTVNGALIGLGYASLFRILAWRPGPFTGAALGLGQWVASSLAAGVLTTVHPRRDQPPSGAFAWRAGPLGVLINMAGHLLLGAMVGRLLRPRLTPSPDHLWLSGAPPRTVGLPPAPMTGRYGTQG